MRKAGAVVSAAIAAIRSAVRPGMTTADLDELAEQVSNENMKFFEILFSLLCPPKK